MLELAVLDMQPNAMELTNDDFLRFRQRHMQRESLQFYHDLDEKVKF